jgi:pimeloyl-ACP methyl ester carboxylesterase
VTYSRPGYGDSTRHAGRSVADCAGDVAAIADQLGFERFHTVGWSGGGPHALATAALLGERVHSAATLASIAPFDAEDLDWMAGMGEENVAEFGAMREGPEQLQAFLEQAAGAMRDIDGDQVLEGLGDLIGPADEAVLTGDFAEYVAALLRGALRPGIWGWFDDDLAFQRDWGFDLGSIEVPLFVWQGDDDRFVPFAHGEWLAEHVAGARPRLLRGEGHLSIVLGAYGRVLDELVAAAA